MLPHKDHAPPSSFFCYPLDIGGDPNRRTKMRQLCAPNKAPNAALGNLILRVSRALGNSIIETVGEIIISEELKQKIEDGNIEIANENREKKHRLNELLHIQAQQNLVIYSMDVIALYQSIKKDMARKIIMKVLNIAPHTE